jgi:hypothetical protein
VGRLSVSDCLALLQVVVFAWDVPAQALLRKFVFVLNLFGAAASCPGLIWLPLALVSFVGFSSHRIFIFCHSRSTRRLRLSLQLGSCRPDSILRVFCPSPRFSYEVLFPVHSVWYLVSVATAEEDHCSVFLSVTDGFKIPTCSSQLTLLSPA